MVVKEWTPKEIRHLRTEQRMSQAEFAELIGVALWTVHRWESGKTDRPSFANLKQLDLLDKVRRNTQ